MVKHYDRTIQYAGKSIAGFSVRAEADPEHYRDFAMVNKGCSLMFKVTSEPLSMATTVLLSQQAWRRESST